MKTREKKRAVRKHIARMYGIKGKKFLDKAYVSPLVRNWPCPGGYGKAKWRRAAVFAGFFEEIDGSIESYLN